MLGPGREIGGAASLSFRAPDSEHPLATGTERLFIEAAVQIFDELCRLLDASVGTLNPIPPFIEVLTEQGAGALDTPSGKNLLVFAAYNGCPVIFFLIEKPRSIGLAYEHEPSDR
ncbi:MAG: hypothetical protein MJE77_22225, partial [Proteobacteria bacterium]|nr:hypothetical protein [Pseudomonadota bacterium]